jgi:myo-inositol-1(or 4)-monophosphatase
MDYLAFLESTLADAAKLALAAPPDGPVRVKAEDADQVVTPTDTAVSAFLKHRIHDRFPDDGIVDEESGPVRGTTPVTWVIDPIDGSSNFAAGAPLYGVMVGVLHRARPVAGAVALPVFVETYVAQAGHGAFLNGSRLTIRGDGDMAQDLISYGIDVHQEDIDLDFRALRLLAPRCRGLRMSNSIFDCMMVAKSAYTAFMHRHNRLWDCVAAQIIIEEAGGIFTDMEGRRLDYTDPTARINDVYSMLACAPHVHDTIKDLIRESSSRSARNG